MVHVDDVPIFKIKLKGSELNKELFIFKDYVYAEGMFIPSICDIV